MDFWKKTKPRTKIQIYLDVLKVLEREKYVKPTNLMYKTNLSWMPLKHILNVLFENKLVEYTEISPKRRLYYLTDEGKKVLEALETAFQIMQKVELYG
jgi:predicted transcriptional regulator